MFPLEMLRSELHADGEWHAAYRTASRTLCSREKEPQVSGPLRQPTCGLCLTAALVFRGIDQSAPAGWAA